LLRCARQPIELGALLVQPCRLLLLLELALTPLVLKGGVIVVELPMIPESQHKSGSG